MADYTSQNLEQRLLEKELITEQELFAAKKKVTSQKNLQQVLIELEIITEEELVNFIAEYMEIPRLELSNFTIDREVLDLIPGELAYKYQCIPVLKIADSLTCAMTDVFDLYALDEIASKTGLSIEPAIATSKEIEKALKEFYQLSTVSVEAPLEFKLKDSAETDSEETTQQEFLGEDAPIVQLVNTLLKKAIAQGASDIHFVPQEDQAVVRFRVDGLLYEQKIVPLNFHSSIVIRIKILSNLDITEHRKPQDGRFQLEYDKRAVDVRVSCVPTIYGENIVLRLLEMGNVLLPLQDLGFHEETLEKYRASLSQPNGILLVTGPTGSGKTTTLYSSLNEIYTSERNIITIEDPVEYRLKGVSQIQVNTEIDLTFGNGLRSILRQDPDIIMVGEVRDAETAEIAIQAALTGHLVLSTLHTNDAPGAIVRLVDMGLEPFLVSSALLGVLGQRLVRKICTVCLGKKCETCLQTGYKGRTGIYEYMTLNSKIHQLIVEKSTLEEIRLASLEAGMLSLRDDGLKKVEQGITTKEEVLRVTKEDG